MADVGLGLALGGAAEARTRRRANDTAERGVEVREGNLRLDRLREANGVIEGLVGDAVSLIEASPDRASIPQDAILGIRGKIDELATAIAGQSGGMITGDTATATFDSAIRAAQTQSEVAIGAAQAEVAGVGATAEALGAPIEDVAQAQGLLPRPAPVTNITVEAARQLFGNPEPGFAWARNPDNSIQIGAVLNPDGTPRFNAAGEPLLAPIQVPIIGGTREVDAAREAAAAAARAEQEQTTSQIVVEDIGRIRDIVTNATIPVTGLGSLLNVIPGTDQRNVRALLDTVKANVGFDKLQQLRDSSPTGGALGQVSERENVLLQSVLGSLEQAQGKEQFLMTLARVERIHGAIIDGPNPALAESIEEMSAEQLAALPLAEFTDAERGLVAQRLTALGL